MRRGRSRRSVHSGATGRPFADSPAAKCRTMAEEQRGHATGPARVGEAEQGARGALRIDFDAADGITER